MSEPPECKPRVLFVDDDRAFLETVREAFASLSGGRWEIETAPDAASTSVALKRQPFDLVVLDLKMPDISGLQLISILNRDYPELLKVFLGAAPEESERVAGLESGAALVLEKPADLRALQSIYATLDELVRWHQRQGSRGAPRRATLLDLIRLECTAGNSRVFEVFNPGTRGQIFIKDGAIVHAECPERRGQSAFSFLATLPEAEFHLRQFAEPSERSIYRQWEFLFLEAVQLQEQLEQASAETRTREATPAQAPAPAPAAPRPAAARRARPADAAPPAQEGETRELFQRRSAIKEGPPTHATPGEAPSATPAPTEPPARRPAAPSGETVHLRMVRSTTGPQAPVDKPPARPPAPEEARLPEVRIEEIVVSRVGREVLFEWQCPQLESRLRFIDDVREKSERLGQHLPVGGVDRLEVQAANGRMVLHLQAEGTVCMRSGSGVASGPAGRAVFHQSMGGWLARHGGTRGLLAAGVLRGDQAPLSHSASREFPREALGAPWRTLQELFGQAATQGLEPWQLRWLFENAQLYAVRRTDGKILGAFLTRDPQALDVAGVERLFQEFKALEAA